MKRNQKNILFCLFFRSTSDADISEKVCLIYFADLGLDHVIGSKSRDINKGKKYALAHFMLPLTTDRYFPDFN